MDNILNVLSEIKHIIKINFTFFLVRFLMWLLENLNLHTWLT